MKKLTAVEWLEEQFEESYSYINEIFKDTFKQAKAMEKQQIIDTADYFTSEWEWYDAEQYYNETFKSE